MSTAGNAERVKIRRMLVDRYLGAVPVTDAMIDAVLAGLADQDQTPEEQNR